MLKDGTPVEGVRDKSGEPGIFEAGGAPGIQIWEEVARRGEVTDPSSSLDPFTDGESVEIAPSRRSLPPG